MAPTWQDWAEWKSRCAAGRCPPEVRHALHGFARSRFATYRERFERRRGMAPGQTLLPEARECWHRFESRLGVPGPRGGMPTKDWIFARVRAGADAPESTVEAGVTLMLRDVVRDYLSEACPSPSDLSLQETLGAGEAGGLTLEELLPGEGPDPRDEAAEREIRALGRQMAAKLAPELDERERIVVWAKVHGVSLAHPRLEQVAGCRRSMLGNLWTGVLRTVRARVRRAFLGESSETLARLALAVLDALAEEVRAEKSLADLRPDSFK